MPSLPPARRLCLPRPSCLTLIQNIKRILYKNEVYKYEILTPGGLNFLERRAAWCPVALSGGRGDYVCERWYWAIWLTLAIFTRNVA